MPLLRQCLHRFRHRPRGIVHAGAHLAEEMDEYLAMQPGLIVWIEADPDLAARARARIGARANGATRQIVIQALITDRDGDPTPFYRFSNEGASSSVFRQTELLRETWPGLGETGDVLVLPSSRLDTALAAHGVTPDQIDVMVLDVQGAELLALRGAGAFLDAARFIEAEVSRAEFYAGGARARDLLMFLAENGFERMTRVPRHGDTVFRALPPAARARAVG
jgi:FkbM family methyltransferase